LQGTIQDTTNRNNANISVTGNNTTLLVKENSAKISVTGYNAKIQLTERIPKY